MLLTDELLLNYKRCRRRTYLDLYGNKIQRDATKEFILKLKRESQTHIAAVLAARAPLVYHRPQASTKDWLHNAQETKALMQQGVDCIYGGILTLTLAGWRASLNLEPTQAQIEIEKTENDNLLFLASPTLLIKQPGKSQWGDWLYIPVNIKLGRRPKQEYKFISAFHAQILAAIQGVLPPCSQLILRQHDDYFVNLEHWLPKMQATVANCLEMLATNNEPEVFISRQKCSLCHWYSHCYTKAKSEQHLSLIPGVTPKRYEYLTTLGIETVESLAATCPINLGEEIGTQAAMELKQQALALLDDRALLKYNYLRTAKTTIPTAAIELYFDIEAEPDRNLDYLLGVLLVDRRKRTEKFYPLLAENPEEEGQIWQEFLALVHSYPNAPIFHFSEYEIDTMKRLAKLYRTPKSQIKSLLSRCVDLHYSITHSVILPVESYSLKSLANWIGFYWRDRGASGDQCVCWYDGWIETRDRSFIEAILRYNEDDCRATFYLKEWLVQFLLDVRVDEIV
jgi:predicted RecB family nuclease